MPLTQRKRLSLSPPYIYFWHKEFHRQFLKVPYVLFIDLKLKKMYTVQAGAVATLPVILTGNIRGFLSLCKPTFSPSKYSRPISFILSLISADERTLLYNLQSISLGHSVTFCNMLFFMCGV